MNWTPRGPVPRSTAQVGWSSAVRRIILATVDVRLPDRLWSLTVGVGVLVVLATLALLAWLLLNPIPVWPRFDVKDGGTQQLEYCSESSTRSCPATSPRLALNRRPELGSHSQSGLLRGDGLSLHGCWFASRETASLRRPCGRIPL